MKGNVKYFYICNKCGEMFSFPRICYQKTEKYKRWFLCCPVCHSEDIELVKVREGEIIYEKKGLEKWF
ncbi:MAG: hypothetical protein DRP11_01990 [Candidatus Aenigmatarchaeota archaeon]|nr:MAG: hypothetical protein DRP11_01990 [Candidatus Aenigmarchaeota archaeon]